MFVQDAVIGEAVAEGMKVVGCHPVQNGGGSAGFSAAWLMLYTYPYSTTT